MNAGQLLQRLAEQRVPGYAAILPSRYALSEQLFGLLGIPALEMNAGQDPVEGGCHLVVLADLLRYELDELLKLMY